MQIASDLHLEFQSHPLDNWRTILEPSAPYLALVGDICELQHDTLWLEFLKCLSPHWKHIFIVNGNHEFYSHSPGMDMQTLLDNQRDMVSTLENVTILENTVVELKEFTVIGTTLWSYVPTKARQAVSNFLNDYRLISVKGETKTSHPISVTDTNNLHENAVRFLHKEITSRPTEKLLVLTHHAPLTKGTSAPQYELPGRLINHGFSTDLSALMKPQVKTWVFGHTHHACDFYRDKTRIVSNPLGYHRGEAAYSNNVVVMTEHVK